MDVAGANLVDSFFPFLSSCLPYKFFLIAADLGGFARRQNFQFFEAFGAGKYPAGATLPAAKSLLLGSSHVQAPPRVKTPAFESMRAVRKCLFSCVHRPGILTCTPWRRL
jgi:hypothetical protein